MASRGRPKKDPNAPKANYNVSSLERARRATRKKIKSNFESYEGKLDFSRFEKF